MTKTAISPTFRREGFTLIELLIVIVVMAILAALLVPTIIKIIQIADVKKSQAFVLRVMNAAGAFKGDNNGRFPGQDDIGLLTGTTPEAGPYTGSQIVAARLFGYPDNEINITPVAGVSATSKYLDYKLYLLIKKSSKGEPIPNNSLADDSSTANALLYFPSRLDVTAPSACYKWNDNSVYVGGTAPAEFDKCITDTRIGAGVARNEGGILIIGTGANDTYLEADTSYDANDDIKSWETETN